MGIANTTNNAVAKSGDKEYYVQIIDNKNNVLGDKKFVVFEGSNLSYSFISRVDYANSTVNVSENLPGKGFEKGTYYVNIFEKVTLVAKSSFTLR